MRRPSLDLDQGGASLLMISYTYRMPRTMLDIVSRPSVPTFYTLDLAPVMPDEDI